MERYHWIFCPICENKTRMKIREDTDKVMERITERNFEMMSGKYQKEQLEIEARLREVTETLNESYEKS